MENSNSIQECTCELGIASVPCQKWGELYDLKTAIKAGTIFKDLDKPFFAGGDDVGK
ncbi:MAG: spore coat associated protein CotJA [Lachnospiraceae bacterium]